MQGISGTSNGELLIAIGRIGNQTQVLRMRSGGAADDNSIDSENERHLNPNRRSNPNELSEAEKAAVRELEERDREVRMHERAHHTAAGELAIGAPEYHYERGPDGQLYATGGGVQIDTSIRLDNPDEAARKIRRIEAAAFAAGAPSAQDRAVVEEARASRHTQHHRFGESIDTYA